MKEKFENRTITGTIKIMMDDHKGIWSEDKSVIVQKIIEISEEYQKAGDTLTLRQLYYQLVSRDIIPNHDKVYKKISSIKDDVVYSGLVDWNVFEDRGRKPVMAYSEESVADALQRTLDSYKLDRQKDQPVHIEVWTEKDAISAILRKVTMPLTISLVINKGYSSSTAMYDAYKRFVEMIELGKKVTILYFGDHDPSGIDMIRDIEDRLMFFLLRGERQQSHWMRKRIDEWRSNIIENGGIPDELYDDDSLHELDENGDRSIIWELAFFKTHFEIVGIGLTMAQIKQYNPPHNPAKLTDPRAKDYIKKYGEVSWEVDALSPKTMREIVASAIAEKMDDGVYQALLEEEESDREKLTKMIKTLE